MSASVMAAWTPSVGRFRRLSLLSLLVATVSAQNLAYAQGPESKPPTDAEGSTGYWWQGDPTPWGMITVGTVYANDNDGPSSNGFRAAFGPCGIGDESYGWAEFWLMFREGGDQDIWSTGLNLVPITLVYRRVALGFMLDIGLERRKYPDRDVLAGILGTGGEFVVRLARRWDFFTAAEIDYRTTFAAETQVRFGIRFHHEKLGVPWKDQ